MTLQREDRLGAYCCGNKTTVIREKRFCGLSSFNKVHFSALIKILSAFTAFPSKKPIVFSPSAPLQSLSAQKAAPQYFAKMIHLLSHLSLFRTQLLGWPFDLEVYHPLSLYTNYIVFRTKCLCPCTATANVFGTWKLLDISVHTLGVSYNL